MDLKQVPDEAPGKWRRIVASFAAARAGDGGTVAALVAGLSDDHAFVRWLAGKGLALSPVGIGRLRDVLEHGAPGARAAAADAFFYADAAAMESLVMALDNADVLVRQSAVEVLARKHHRGLLPHLNKLMEDDSPWVRRAAAMSAGHLGERTQIPRLISLLHDESFLVRRSAAYALGAMRAVESLDNLVNVLTDADPGVRRNAAWSLGRIGDRRALPSLRNLLGDHALDGEVAAEAERAAAAIERPALFKRR